MKRKLLRESHAEFISADEVNRFMLQMNDEEQDSMSIRDIIAEILGTKPENIKNITASGSGWKVQAIGDMDDLENILDDNADVLQRLKGGEDDDDDDIEEWEREGYPSEIAYKNRWRDYEE